MNFRKKAIYEIYLKVVESKKTKKDDSVEKDECYYKVKSRYKKWPSAYASGALVKCRQVGADNWGKSSTKKKKIRRNEEMRVSYFKLEKLRKFLENENLRRESSVLRNILKKADEPSEDETEQSSESESETELAPTEDDESVTKETDFYSGDLWDRIKRFTEHNKRKQEGYGEDFFDIGYDTIEAHPEFSGMTPKERLKASYPERFHDNLEDITEVVGIPRRGLFVNVAQIHRDLNDRLKYGFRIRSEQFSNACKNGQRILKSRYESRGFDKRNDYVHFNGEIPDLYYDDMMQCLNFLERLLDPKISFEYRSLTTVGEIKEFGRNDNPLMASKERFLKSIAFVYYYVLGEYDVGLKLSEHIRPYIEDN